MGGTTDKRKKIDIEILSPNFHTCNYWSEINGQGIIEYPIEFSFKDKIIDKKDTYPSKSIVGF
jgi:hypothetical protein